MNRMDDAAIREAQAREPIAHEELMRVTGMGDWWGRRGEIRAHIPADPERDTDLVIGRSLQDVPALAAEALARGEESAALRAEVERLTRERDEALSAADATIDVTPGEGLASVVRRVCEESNDTQAKLDRATHMASKAHAARESAEAEVARLRAEAIPADAEERGAIALYLRRCCVPGAGYAAEREKERWTIVSPETKEAYRSEARAVLAALRRQA